MSADADDRIAELRARIDALDGDLVRVLDERARVAAEIGRIKQGGGQGFYAPARELEVLARARAASSGDFPRPALDAVLREVMSASRALLSPTRVVYAGVPGGLTHVAARSRFGTSSTFSHEASSAALLDAIAAGRADYGVVPFGDAVEGLIDSPVRLFGEFATERAHGLLASPGTSDVRTVYAHPSALALCATWFARAAAAGIRIVPVDSGVDALQRAAHETGAAALVPDALADDDTLSVIERALDDEPQRRRYWLLSLREPARSTHDTTVLVLVLRQAPGSLADVLARFGAVGLSVSWVDMRATHHRAWEHVFVLQVSGHHTDPAMDAVVRHLPGVVEMVRVLGSFPSEA